MDSKRSPISRLERWAIFLYALTASVFIAYLFMEEAFYESRMSEARAIGFAIDDFGHRPPGGAMVFIPLIAAALIRPRRFWVSSSLTGLAIILFLVGCSWRVEYAKESGFTDPLTYAVDVGDYLLGAFLLITMTWLLSILWRLRQGLQTP